ncbi:MAG TPA: ATP-binding protein, partial [bacterium]|nr:ATP-binding protein [bacterium]
ETDQDVWVDISDNGCGIPQDTLNKLFEPFFTTKARGVGLGLHIVKTIVEQNHGGKINIVSEPDRGTTIHFTIPKKEEDGEKNTVNRG